MGDDRAKGGERPIPDAGAIADYARVAHREVVRVRGTTSDGHCLDVPLMRETRRVHRIALQALSAAGYTFFDYPAVDECERQADALPLTDALRAAGRRAKADIVFLNNLLWPAGMAEPPPKAGEVVRFDARKSNTGWDFILKKSDVVRYRNKAKREAGYTVEHYEGEIARPLLDQLAALHVERWAFDNVGSGLAAQERRDLYFGMRGIAVVTVLRDGENVFAAHYGLKFGNALIWHTPIINIRYLDHSPIKALLFEVADYCRANGYDILDFGLGDEEYKIRFANETLAIREILIALSLRGRLVTLLHAHAARLETCFRTSRDVLRRARDAIGRMGTRVDFFIYPAERARQVPESQSGLSFAEISNYPEFIDACRSGGVTPRRYHRERFRLGDRFICAIKEGEIVSYGWVAAGRDFVATETGETLDLDAHRLLYDFYTKESQRGRGYYTALLKVAVSRTKDLPILIFATSGNKPSRRAIEKAGFQELSRSPPVRGSAQN